MLCVVFLLQTGSGHFSPVGGYHDGRDMEFVLDVARFKYPPHWVPLKTHFVQVLCLCRSPMVLKKMMVG